MVANVGVIDRMLRVVVGAALVTIALLVSHPYAWIAWIGLVPLVTGVVGNCPAYRLLGLNSCPLTRR
ncbi:hypothetical protein BAL199_05054 [alpha proteobacterium BAL199]|nr:hypothetical protein BAL199_05054 [alpha proteobacterium BAL199]